MTVTRDKVRNVFVWAHEHYFSPKIDDYEADIVGRFDAVDASDGHFVYVPEANEWFRVGSYEAAKRLARECAEAW